MSPAQVAKSASSLKRKQSSQETQSSRKRARVRYQDARVIASQTSGAAYKNGELNVDKFVKAREFEIKALEDGMHRSKKSLTSRAFQDVPRELRRRTASHNAKRVPKRLRRRAQKEMQEDNTPTVSAKTRPKTSHMRLRLDEVQRRKHMAADIKLAKLQKDEAKAAEAKIKKPPAVKKNALRKPQTPKAKFRKRQVHKAWLPTHLFHAKRAHMTPPKEPLWRMAIPLSPTDKSYRATHRASTARGGMAWDVSYKSTIGLEGVQRSLENILKALGLGRIEGAGFWEDRTQRWLRGTRSWTGWLHERDAWPAKSIAPVNVIWCAQERADEDVHMENGNTANQTKAQKRRLFIRVHPSAFLQLWEELKRLSKVQKPGVTIEDLRFEIGSIELSGPGSTEALVGSLWPCQDPSGSEKDAETPIGVWKTLSSVSNPASLPRDALLAFDISDPRLHYPPRTAHPQTSTQDHTHLTQILTTWPLDRTQSVSDLFNRNARYTAARQLPSQKAINRRKALAQPGTYPDPTGTDPKIPILLFTEACEHSQTSTWTLLLPWKCVLPVWYALMYYPLSTGGTLRFGGLDQKRQIYFQHGQPWFPGDFPGTKAGRAWEEEQRAKRLDDWEKHPKGKRVEWSTLNLGHAEKGEVGHGWACDWELLEGEARQASASETAICHVPSSIATKTLGGTSSAAQDMQAGLVTVKVTLLERGVPMTCARIYRLPADEILRERWLALLPSQAQKVSKAKRPQSLPKDAPEHLRRRYLAASLLEPPPPPNAGSGDYPNVPSKDDLIGFVTTGNFNLAEGKGIGLGNIILRKVLGRDLGTKFQNRLCIVRTAGTSIGRLAKWDIVL